jgi:hypothetical protein
LLNDCQLRFCNLPRRQANGEIGCICALLGPIGLKAFGYQCGERPGEYLSRPGTKYLPGQFSVLAKVFNDLAQCLQIVARDRSISQNGEMGCQTSRENFGLAVEMKIEGGTANVSSGRNRVNVQAVVAYRQQFFTERGR